MKGTIVRLKAEVRDPYGIRTAISSHPYITAGVATGAGVVMVRLLTRRTSDQPGAPTRIGSCAYKLLEGFLSVLRPLGEAWLLRAIQEVGAAVPTPPQNASKATRVAA